MPARTDGIMLFPRSNVMGPAVPEPAQGPAFMGRMNTASEHEMLAQAAARVPHGVACLLSALARYRFRRLAVLRFAAATMNSWPDWRSSRSAASDMRCTRASTAE
jgi:hypothetical protein